MGHLIENIEVIPTTIASVVTLITTQYSAAVDMRDAEGVLALYLGSSGTWGTTGEAQMIHLQGASDTGATFVNIGSTSLVEIEGGANDSFTNKALILDTLHPNQNFIRLGLSQSSGIGGRSVLIKYGLRKRGTSGVNADATHVGAYGTLINPTTV